MKITFLDCLFVMLTLCTCTSGLWAQDRNTMDGLTFTSDSNTPSHASTTQPNAEASRAQVSAQLKEPVILNFDKLPGPLWETWDCGDGIGNSGPSHGILTIDASSCYEFGLWHPNGKWHKLVNNARGWIIEAGLKVDPITEPACNGDRGSVLIWANDHTNLIIIGFSTNEISIAYPDYVRFPMDTTNAFHIYRIESKGNRVKVYVDGDLKINHILSWTGGGSDVLTFGDGDGCGTSLSYWDYFSYDVFP